MKFEKQLNPEYVRSHPSVDYRIEQMQGSLPCYYQVYKEVWGQLPAGLKGAGGNGNVQCPPIVTGVMGQIRGNTTDSYADNRDDTEAYEEGYDDGYSNGRKSRRIAYDWSDFYGYNSIYYDHAYYGRHFYYDPYYISWNYGFSNYMSYRIVFGGYNYYRWSPGWAGWTYYAPYRPYYRISKKNRKHYRRHERFDKRPNYTPRKRYTRQGTAVTYDRASNVKKGRDRSLDERRVARKQRLNEGSGVLNRQSNAQRPRRVTRDGQVATQKNNADNRVRGGTIQQTRGAIVEKGSTRDARREAVLRKRGGEAVPQTNGNIRPKADTTRRAQPSKQQRQRTLESISPVKGQTRPNRKAQPTKQQRYRAEQATKPTRQQTRPTRKATQPRSETIYERPRAQNRTPATQPSVKTYSPPKQNVYVPPKQKVYKAPKQKVYKAPKATLPKTMTPKQRNNARKSNRRVDN